MDEPTPSRESSLSPITVGVGVLCVAAVLGVGWWAIQGSGDGTGSSSASADGRANERADASAATGRKSAPTDADAYVQRAQPAAALDPTAPDEPEPEIERKRVTAPVPVPEPPPTITADMLDPVVPIDELALDPESHQQRVDDLGALYTRSRDLDLGTLSEDEAVAEIEALVADTDLATEELLGVSAAEPELEVRGYLALGRMYDRLELLTAEQIALSDREEITRRLAAPHGETAARMMELAVRSADQSGIEVPGLDDARAFVAQQGGEASAANP